MSVVDINSLKGDKAALYPEVVEAPRYTCALGGAYAAALATYGTVPILHSGAGCGMANSHGMTFAAGLNTGGAQGTTSTPCSCLVEEHVIFGGEEKLRKLVKSTKELMKGDLYAVISGCVPALIGDDVESVVREFNDEDKPVIHIKTAGFVGNSYVGYELFFDAVINQLLTEVPKEKGLVNIFGVVPNQHVFWKGEVQVIQELLEKIGVKVNTIFTDFEGLKALKRIPAAELNLVFSPWVGVKTVQKLQDKFATPYEVINGVPIGPKQTSEFLRKVAEKLNLDQDFVNNFIAVEERKAYRYAEYMSELFVISVPHAFFGVVADSNTAISLLRYGTNELGWNPHVVILTDNPPEEYRENIIKNLTEGLEGVFVPEVIFEVDSHKIREHLGRYTFQVILSSSLEKYLAQDEFHSIHLGVSFPIYDRAILDRSYAGYRGGLAFIEDLTATYAGPL